MARKHPSPEMIRDIEATFSKHNWSGKPLGITSLTPAEKASLKQSTPCPPGTTPKQVTYQLPDGTWVTTTICV